MSLPFWRSYMIGVHVPHDGVYDFASGFFQNGDGANADHLVHHRRQRNRGSGHFGDARAPHTAGNDDGASFDVAFFRTDALDTPLADMNIQCFSVMEDAKRRHLVARSRMIVPARSESTTPTEGV